MNVDNTLTSPVLAMARGFAHAALWADCTPLEDGNGEESTGERGGCEHLPVSPALLAYSAFVCGRFVDEHWSDIVSHCDALPDPDGGDPMEYVGHTLYLSAAGHGVGFTDRRGEGPVADALVRLEDGARALAFVEYTEVYAATDARGLVVGTVDYSPEWLQAAQRQAADYGLRDGEGSGALRYFGRTGQIGRGLRAYLSGPLDSMPPGLRTVAAYVATH